MFAALASRNFRIYVAGQLVSNIGGWTQRIAQDWLVLTLTGSTTAVGLTTALQFLPTILFGPAGGLVADRFPKRTVLLVTQTVMAGCAVTLATLTLSGNIHVWQIYMVASVLGLAAAIDNPTRQSFTNDLVGPALLRNAISLNSTVFQLGALIGPAAGGVMIGIFGIGWAFVVNACSFVGAISAVAAVRTSRTVGHLPMVRGRGQLRVALTYLLETPRIRHATILAGVLGFFTMSFPVTLASFSSSVFHSGPSGFALFTSLLAGGSVVGSLMIARRGVFRLRGLVSLAAALTVAQGVAALAPNAVSLGILLFALGISMVAFGISANSIVQLACADHIRGRVLGLYLMVVLGAGCLGGPAVGAIDEHLGPRFGLLVGAAAGAAVTALTFASLSRSAGWSVVPMARERLLLAGSRLDPDRSRLDPANWFSAIRMPNSQRVS